MWDVEGSVPLVEGVEAKAVLRRLESDLGMMAHTTVWPGEDCVAFRVSSKRWWLGGLPMDQVDIGKLRVDPAARCISFHLSMSRLFLWSLAAVPFFFVGGLLTGWSPFAAAGFGIGAFVFSWVVNHWRVEKRVTRYLMQVAAGAPYKAPIGLTIRIGM